MNIGKPNRAKWSGHPICTPPVIYGFDTSTGIKGQRDGKEQCIYTLFLALTAL